MFAHKAVSELKRSPFSASDDGHEIFWSKAHRLAFDRLDFAAKNRAPLTIFTGDPGTGRSTLIRELARREKSERLIRIVPDPAALSDDACAGVLNVFGKPHEPGRRDLNCAGLATFLASAGSDGSAPLLIVDDADRLSEEALSALCYFATGGLDEGPRLKLVLVGSRPLHGWVDRRAHDLVGPSFELGPMTEEDTAAYVRHVVKAAGGRPDDIDAAALKEIFAQTNGVAQKIGAAIGGYRVQPPRQALGRIHLSPVQAANIAAARPSRGMTSGDMTPKRADPPPAPQALSQNRSLTSVSPPVPPKSGSQHPVAPSADPDAPATVLASILGRSGAPRQLDPPPLILTEALVTSEPTAVADAAPAPATGTESEEPALASASRSPGWRLEAIALILLATIGGAAQLTEPGTPLEIRLADLRERADTLLGTAPPRTEPEAAAAPATLAAARPRSSADQYRTAPSRTEPEAAAAPATLAAARPRSSADQYRTAPSRAEPEAAAAPATLAAARPRSSADQYRTAPSRTGSGAAPDADLAAPTASIVPRSKPLILWITSGRVGEERTENVRVDRNRGGSDRTEAIGRGNIDRNSNVGRSGGSNVNRNGGDNVGKSGGSNAGASGGGNAGASGGSNAGASGGSNAGASGGSNSGASGGSNAGASGGSNAGASGGSNSGASGGGGNAGASGGSNSGGSGSAKADRSSNDGSSGNSNGASKSKSKSKDKAKGKAKGKDKSRGKDKGGGNGGGRKK
ncbi:AAA family ATPase [Defluviimonas sp. D31]|uniref:ExeA family protein n=1 Tax=Defluviimonas sp. D31 TaxID=3083253 RepID=UPI00296F25D7|nr:AAA family ATPase [Defluviimonas sp. D31]MDW4547943.1 AAA family ATPase [Defluviimonas sp. D31]